MKNEIAKNPLKLIGQINRTFARVVDAPLRELGFAIGQLPVLVALKRSGELPQSELARIAQVEQPSMAQLLNRMERDGLVSRVPSPSDKRSHLLSLTPEAAKRMPKGKAVMDRVCRTALSGFSAEEEAQLLAFLLRVNVNLGNGEPDEDL
ncbi:MarR family transcriptional regulator [Herbaspirillum lusitanum]|jgi:DNA-binding MarR family transcriptional regulator|uniref:MarR family transcriptional regulator n=1 Tax=Herbaspirillum lusitanum TaxID=213312 RepID=A0ABW9A758_9BURK